MLEIIKSIYDLEEELYELRLQLRYVSFLDCEVRDHLKNCIKDKIECIEILKEIYMDIMEDK